jgi:putative drug exporter of the RND superfamily
VTLRRPRLGLALVLASCAALGIAGLGVEEELQPLSLKVPGTAAAEGEDLARSHFGDSSPFAILLQGPAGEVERQGIGLVAALRREPEVTVLSPWDRGAVSALRPGPRRALVVADFHVPLEEAMRETAPRVEHLLEARIEPPVMATQSGFASASRALQEEALDATERAELLAAPLLVLVLLLVFRSVVAAAIPLAFGALTVIAGRGVLALLGSAMTVDALSLVVCSMMGLALGVDYSLLVVSRFREELEDGRDRWQAAAITRASAGRTTLFAGTILIVALVFSAFLQPGSLLLSLATATAVVTVISVVVSIAALPPLLGLLGERINAGRIGRGPVNRGLGRTVAGAASTALRRPALAACLIAIPLVLLALPAFALTTGAPGIDQLPSSNPARQSAERIDRAIGPGWEAPFVLVAAAERGTIATPERLALLARWQRRIAAQPGVGAVIGPAPIAAQARPLRDLGARLTEPGSDGPAQLGRLGPSLRRAAGAVERLRTGLAAAAAGSGLLATGAGRADAGAGLIADGLQRAASGGARATAGIERLEAGSARLARGQDRLSAGTLSLALGLRALVPRVRGDELTPARKLARRLERVAAADPSLAPAAEEAQTLALAIAANRDEVRRLRETAQGVNGGVNRLVPGGRRLEGGVRRLSAAAAGLSGGLERLGTGAERLADGLAALRGGAGALRRGLAGGFHRSYPLQAGLRRAGVRVSAVAAPLARGVHRLRRDSPRLFESGHFVLSALDGAAPVERAAAAEAIALDGGQAARMLIVSGHGFNTDGSRRTGERLLAEAERLGREEGLQTGLTGGAAILNTYGEATRARLPFVIGAFILFSLLALVVVVRAPLLALLTVLLNLGSVAAALGVMSLVCQIPEGYPLGGHPYIDTVGAGAIFGVTFGLSIDYAVFLIARMRERYEVDGDNAAAIAFGLKRTAGVITGAAAIMAAVFVSFATAPIATVSQMGVGLTVAILLDATVVRIVLLPALMLLLGDRVWHVPPALDRILPNRHVFSTRAGATGS